MDEFDSWERPKTRIQWMLGNNCNYHCSYCLDIFHKSDHPSPDQDFFLDTCKDIIYHYDELGRDVVFEFLGGEPTLVEKIPDIGNRLSNFPTNIVLKTNGSASIEWWQKTRRYLSEVIISVHREYADINHIINVIELLHDDSLIHPLNVKVLFPVTNHPESWQWGVKHLKKFRKRYGLGELQLLYSNFGKGSDMYLPYRKEQWDEYNKLHEITPNNEHNSQNNTSFTNYLCYAGIETLIIDSLGNVSRGWCNQGGFVGNIYNPPVKWPTEPIICKKDFCKNGFDQFATKSKH